MMRREKERLKGQGTVISNLIFRYQNETGKEKEYLKNLEFLNSIKVLIYFAEQALIWSPRIQLKPNTQIPTEVLGVMQTLVFNNYESLRRRLAAIAIARANILRRKRLVQFHSLSETGRNPVDSCKIEDTIALMRLEVKLLQLEYLYKEFLEVTLTEPKPVQKVE